MCGISGFNFSDRALIEKMNACVKHRGPDGDGVFVADAVSLGHTRLAILDLSEKGKQPMAYRNGELQLTFNGEIYNFQELREALARDGYTFQSQTDSEVILALYDKYGVDCVKHLNGIFAFAIWDRREQQLFVARDHVGVKPFYYFSDGDKFIFSSEIKALLVHDIPRQIDHEALNIYLRMLYVPAPLTMFAGIKKLEPGSYLLWKKGTLEKKRYWHPTHFSDVTDRGEAVAQIRTLMKDAVRGQLISDRPVGVFLSGGVDSTIITGLASEITNSSVKTFSARFDVPGEKFNFDADAAKKTSAHYHTDHHEYVVTGKDAAQVLPEVIYHMDEPVANTTQIATYLLSKYAREHVVVALGGDGGDELFGGYDRYRLSQWMTRYQSLPRTLRHVTDQILSRHTRGKKLVIPPGDDRYLAFMAQKETDISRVLVLAKNTPDVHRSFYQTHFFADEIADPEKQLMWADIQSWLPDESLVRSDKMSMASALEQRVPILDHRLVELALHIPTAWKISRGEGKVIFKEAMRDYLPEHVLHQPKRGWFSPTSIWLRTDLRDLAYEVLSPSYAPGTEILFDFKNIRTLLDDHMSGRAYHMNLLWALITFQMWYRRFLS